MKKLLKIMGVVAVCATLFCYGCMSSSSAIDEVLIEKLDGVPMGRDYITYVPNDILVDTSYFYMFGANMNHYCYVSDITGNGQDYEILKIGRGPNEYISPRLLHKTHDNLLYIYNEATRELRCNQLIKENDSLKIQTISSYMATGGNMMPNTEMIMLDNGYVVGMPFMGRDSLFALYSYQMEYLGTFGKLPIEWEKKGDVNLYAPFAGKLSSSGNRLFYAAHNIPYVACYEISDNGSVKLCWEKFYGSAEAYIENNSIKFTNSSKKSFMDVEVGYDFIYLTYCGHSISELAHDPMLAYDSDLVVINYDGNICGRYETNYPLSNITISEDQKYLYTVCSVDDRIDIVSFKLPNVSER